MGSARTVEAKAPERSPAATLARAPVAAAAARPSSAAALQRHLGNSAVVALAGNAASLAISSPGDPAEREAVRVAAVVAQPARPDAGRDASAAVGRVGPSVQHAPLAQPQGTPRTASPALRAAIDRSLSGGTALSSGLRAFMEPRLGASLAAVRIHTDETAATLSRRLNARAFTVGNHVFFGRAAFQPESADGRGLIAHELAHVLQQGGATPRAIQRDLADNVTEIFDSLSPEQLVRRAIKSFFPELGEVIDKGGVAEALSALAADGAERLFAPLRQPLEGIASVGAEVAAALGPTVATLQAAGKQIAQNDCTPIRLASERIEATVLRLLTPVVEKVQPVVARVEELLAALWQKFGAPILDWIKSVLAEDWAALQKLAGYVKDAAVWLWDKTEDTRDQYARHWAILKNLLGIGDAPDGRNGILQWVEVKLGAAWDRIKARLAPYTTQLKAIGAAVAGVLLVFSPAGPILALGAAAAEVAKGIAWVAQNWGKGNILVTARNYVEKTLLPPLVAALDKVSAQVARVADSLATSLGSLAASLAKAVASLGEDAVAVVVRLAQWLADQVQAMAAAVNARVAAVRLWLDGAFDGLVRFLRRAKAFLGRVADVAIDIYALPLLLGEKLWDAVPACLRDPFVDFFGKIIVGQVELFSELVKDDEAWKRTKDEVAGLIRQVFHTKDLVGAIKAGFLFVLRIFNLPPDLLAQVAAKAMAAWETVARAPLAFLRTTIRALGEGFRLIWDDRLTNLKNGLRGWLLREIKDKNLVVPDDWTNTGQVFDFVLSLLGLSVDHVLELVEKRFPGSTEPLRKAIGRVQKVMEWVHRSIDVTKSPKENAKGMLDQARTFGLSLLQSGAEWIIGKVAAKVTQELAKAAGTAGFGALLTAAQSIYAALVTARKWMRQILDMADKALDSVIDLAAGAVAKVGTVFAGLMKQAMPVVIGFLADQVGLGDVGRGLGKAIEKLRAEVDKALLWLINKIAAGIRWLIGTGKKAVGKLMALLASRPVKIGSETHTIYVRGDDKTATITMSSLGELGLDQHIANIRNKHVRGYRDAGASDVAARLEGRLDALSKTIGQMVSEVVAGKIGAEAAASKLQLELSSIAKDFHISGLDWPADGGTDYVASLGSHKRVSAATAKLSILSYKKGRSTTGTENVPGISIISRPGDKYQRGHILARVLGGNNELNNLTPLSRDTNQNMRIFAERQIREQLDPGLGRPTFSPENVIAFSATCELPTQESMTGKIGSIVNTSVGHPGRKLFDAAEANEFGIEHIKKLLEINDLSAEKYQRVCDVVMRHFAARKINIRLQVLRGTAVVGGSYSIDNHM